MENELRFECQQSLVFRSDMYWVGIIGVNDVALAGLDTRYNISASTYDT